MENYHNFEFLRSRKSMVWFIRISLVAVFLSMLFSAIDKIIRPPNDSEGLYAYCMEHSTVTVIKDFNLWIFRISYLPFLILSYAIIYLKSSEDLLENVSTLNYLIKVSVFQIYRNNNYSK